MKTLWKSLEQLPLLNAVEVEWRNALGNEFERAQRFLTATPKDSSSYPCVQARPCGCRHRILPVDGKGWIAVCRCEDTGCDTVYLEPKDAILHELSIRKLFEAANVAFGVFKDTFAEEVPGIPRCFLVGTWNKLSMPVYFYAPHDESGLIKTIAELRSKSGRPFVMALPTGAYLMPPLETVLNQHRCMAFGLDAWLALEKSGKFRLLAPIQPLLDEFERRLVEGDGIAVLQRIDRKFDRLGDQLLEAEDIKSSLNEMKAGGFFSFVNNVDTQSLKILCAVLAEGDVAKAARKLDMPDSTLRSRIYQWKSKGGVYKTFPRLIEWRKRTGFKQKVSFNDALLYQNERGINYNNLLADIFEQLFSMNTGNWKSHRNELVEMLQPYISR